MLDPHQRARATIAAQTFGDIVTRSDPTVRPMAFAGLPAAEMTIAQQRQLRRLLELYAGRMADSSARRQLRRIEDAGFGRLHFAWAGAHQPRYRTTTASTGRPCWWSTTTRRAARTTSTPSGATWRTISDVIC
jgi:hypothetical protein